MNWLSAPRLPWAAFVVLATVMLGAAFTGPATAQIFSVDQPLELRLAAPFATAMRRRSDPEYQAAELVYRDAAGADVTLPLRVRVRGRSRAEYCEFPPLLLNFRTDDLTGTLFAGEDRLKLVTHCDSRRSYDQYLLLEYSSYRVLSVLTDASLRQRLVAATYVDTQRGRELGERPAILLEDEERFAARRGWQLFDQPSIERTRYDPAALALLDVFQYFIGNTDWSATDGPGEEMCCHNVVPYVSADGTLVPVPYDFDSAGIVDAPHALPDERLPINDVRKRLYRGLCRSPAELEPTFALFLERRAAIEAVFDGQQGLTPQVAARTRDYVEEFYAVLADSAAKERAFYAGCDR